MLKLAQNAFAESNMISDFGSISFNYIEKLHLLQEVADLKLVNKLNHKHIYFKDNKMNVRLAVQVLSNSVADSTDFLRKSGHKDFQGSETTTKFIRIIDRLFDIMNSRNSFGTGFKSSMMINNLQIIKQIFDDSMTLISSIKIDDKNIFLLSQHTFAVGFRMNTESYYNLACDLLNRKEKPLKYLTYNLYNL